MRPIKELESTAELSRLVEESPDAIAVTKNGYESFVAMSPKAYEALRLEASRAQLCQAMDQAEQDISTGRAMEARGAIADHTGGRGPFARAVHWRIEISLQNFFQNRHLHKPISAIFEKSEGDALDSQRSILFRL